MGVLRQVGASPAFLRSVWSKCQALPADGLVRCPHCNHKTVRVTTESGGHRLNLDVCPRCPSIWLDAGEIEATLKAGTPKEQLERERRQRLAIVQVKVEHALDALDKPVLGDEYPPEWWQWLPALAEMPVEEEVPARACRPWLTWGIAAVVAIVFLATKGHLEETVKAFGFTPTLSGGKGLLTIWTAFFIHAGSLHVVTNLYFFLVFGDNVEDHLGRVRFLLLLVGAHLVGFLVHAWLDPHAGIPCVGASAGISGILACYAVSFPRARLGLFLWFWILPKYLRMPALEFIGMYLIIQLVGAWQQVSGFADVSYMAHLGGLAVGVGVGMVVRFVRARETARALSG